MLTCLPQNERKVALGEAESFCRIEKRDSKVSWILDESQLFTSKGL
jgi:hypothetical protein